MTLRERCKSFYQRAQQDAMLRQGDPVEALMAFVMSEQGRAADKRLEDTKPLILYFGTEADRDDFMAIVREAKPGMMAKRIP